ncbi:MAG: phosphatase PAP2 family protein [Paracoccaceae bacterium]
MACKLLETGSPRPDRPVRARRTRGILIVVFLALLSAYAISVGLFVSLKCVATDQHVADLLYNLRDDRMVALFAWITALGNWRTVVAALAGATSALLLLRRTEFLAALWFVAAGNQLTVTLLKSAFNRPRPAIAYFTETSGSFPSGHAAAAVAVWGMLCYLGWRLGWLRGGTAVLWAVALAVLIGFSRIYLGEHYLSDVVNGGLIGALWFTVGVAACEWWSDPRSNAATPVASGRRQGPAVFAMALGLGAAAVVASTLPPAVNHAAQPVPPAVEPAAN